jgi:Domain of unknown function (DUF4276)
MKIVLLCEGKTEVVVATSLRDFVQEYCKSKKIRAVGIDAKPFGCELYNRRMLRTRLELHAKNPKVIGVVALADVRPTFETVKDAKDRLRQCMKNSPHREKYYAHVAKMEIEAWLLPFWSDIEKNLKVKLDPPGAKPEDVNDEEPPSFHLKALYRRAGKSYSKVLHAKHILKRNSIEESAKTCPELRSFLNTLTRLCDLAQA